MTKAEKETRANLINRWMSADRYFMFSDDHKVYMRGRKEWDELVDDCKATGNDDLYKIAGAADQAVIDVFKKELSKLEV